MQAFCEWYLNIHPFTRWNFWHNAFGCVFLSSIYLLIAWLVFS